MLQTPGSEAGAEIGKLVGPIDKPVESDRSPGIRGKPQMAALEEHITGRDVGSEHHMQYVTEQTEWIKADGDPVRSSSTRPGLTAYGDPVRTNGTGPKAAATISSRARP